MALVLVTGATGNVGRELIPQLVSDGHEVRAMAHDSDTRPRPQDAEFWPGDPSQPERLASALRGAETVFFSAPLAALPAQARTLSSLVRDAGVRRVVFNSSVSIEVGHAHALAKEHVEAEEAIIASGCAWTFLRSGSFFSNSIVFWGEAIRASEAVRSFLTDQPIAAIDPYDVASVAARTLDGEDWSRQIVGLTGGEMIRPSEQVSIISELLGRPIDFRVMTDEEALESFLPRYQDPAEAKAKLGAVRAPERPYAEPRQAVAMITGRKPRTFRQWAERNLDRFK
jgi:uncharacterized protein YbjT (DUF2867 family)